jgi:hypothetical protein
MKNLKLCPFFFRVSVPIRPSQHPLVLISGFVPDLTIIDLAGYSRLTSDAPFIETFLGSQSKQPISPRPCMEKAQFKAMRRV